MRRILIVLLLAIGLVGGTAASSGAAKAVKSAFATPAIQLGGDYSALTADGTACTITVAWSHPNPEQVAAYYMVEIPTVTATLPVPKSKTAVPGILVSGTSYVVEKPVPVDHVNYAIIAKSTSGKWSNWAEWGYYDPTPWDC